MSTEQPAVLQFPAFLHGPLSVIRRKAKAEGKWYAQQYLKHGAFPLPRQSREVAAGEGVYTHTLADFPNDTPAWRLYLLHDYIQGVEEGSGEEASRRGEPFEEFLLGTSWGALFRAVHPRADYSAERMAPRLAAVLRFWEVLQTPRYLHQTPNQSYQLDALMKEIYGRTLEAWCPKGPASIREHLEATVERMRRATREDCMEAVLRLAPTFLTGSSRLKHVDVLRDPNFLRERLGALTPERFARFSSAYSFAVYAQLAAWDRELENP